MSALAFSSRSAATMPSSCLRRTLQGATGRALVLQGSVTVQVGDHVRRGQPLAAVGNNGHSNEPHLHLQVQDSPACADAEKTYPIVFRNVHISTGGYWPWADNSEVRTGDLVSASDPPARAEDLYQVDGETAHLQCQGSGSPTLVLLGGMGATTTTWSGLRAAIGPDVRTCAGPDPCPLVADRIERMISLGLVLAYCVRRIRDR